MLLPLAQPQAATAPHARHDPAAARATQQHAWSAAHGSGGAPRRTKVQVARPALADDLVEVAVLRRHVARAPPELRRRRGQERARAARPLRREHAARGDPGALQRPRPGPRVSRELWTADSACGRTQAGHCLQQHRHVPWLRRIEEVELRHIPAMQACGWHDMAFAMRALQAGIGRAPQLGGLRVVIYPAKCGVLAAKHAAGLWRGRRAPALRRAQQPQHVALHLGRRARGGPSGGMRSQRAPAVCMQAPRHSRACTSNT